MRAVENDIYLGLKIAFHYDTYPWLKIAFHYDTYLRLKTVDKDNLCCKKTREIVNQFQKHHSVFLDLLRMERREPPIAHANIIMTQYRQLIIYKFIGWFIMKWTSCIFFSEKMDPIFSYFHLIEAIFFCISFCSNYFCQHFPSKVSIKHFEQPILDL